jgi:UDP-N-acetylmuramyl pentapeptide phosphotransferase/UDP-N-acetylglucosamine-1-phosphate transferase
MIFSLPADSVEIRYVAGALVILFFIGLKDDILVIDPKKKLLGQVLAALLIVILGDFRITNFHGIFSIGDISYIPSVLITVFLILSLINGFNLIDGVDGLSSGIGIVNSFFFGGWFLLIHEITLAVIAFSIAGSLSAYFIFNVFGKGNKIFMGDTGSMITGLIISVLVICFIQKENDFTTLVNFKSAPAFAFALVLLPLFDTLRIIVLRLLMGKSPFKADRNHIHHNLLKLGLSHLQITLLLTFATLVFVILVALLKHINSLLLIIMMLFLAALLTLWLDFSVKGKSDGNQL